MDIIEIDKFLQKKTCDYCIKFFEANKKHWKSYKKAAKIEKVFFDSVATML